MAAKTRAAVIGGGSWGTALAIHCARRGMEVALWVFEGDLASRMAATRVNDVYLPGFTLPPEILPDGDIGRCLSGADLVLSVVPSHVLRSVWSASRGRLPEKALIVNATKGIEEGTLLTSSGVLAEVLGEGVRGRLVTLSGPTFAKEVAKGLPGAAVAASKDAGCARRVQDLLNSETFRLYTNRDPVGVEIAGSLKNVMAIAAGICEGLRLGHNARAALITRGLAEMSRLGASLGADPLTFQGLAGIGDLVLTCTGDLSRNRTLGARLGAGETLEAILGSSPMVAEGVRTAASAHDLARRRGVVMPITEEVHRVLYEGRKPMDALHALMTRVPKGETC